MSKDGGATGYDRNANAIPPDGAESVSSDEVMVFSPDEGLCAVRQKFQYNSQPAITVHQKLHDKSSSKRKDTDDALTADFRFRIGLLPEEEEGLSEAFRASIGLSGPEPVAEITELELAQEKQYEATLRGYKFEKYAKKHFQSGNSLVYSNEPLKGPLLPKKHEIDKLAAPLLWLAIQRFMGDIQTPPVTTDRSRTPVMTRIYRVFESYSKKRRGTSSNNSEAPSEGKEKNNSEKRKSWRKLFSRSNSTSEKHSAVDVNPADTSYPKDHSARLSVIPTEDIDVIHYVVGHGILRRELRDEIYCQLCKQLRQNPSKENTLNGWILLALCAGCFRPSEQFEHYLQSFLREAPSDYKDYSMYTRRIIKRTSANGPRYHPPNWLEFQATKMRKYVLLPVALPDGSMQSVEADSSITAGEITAKIASEINLKDLFGFSIFICINDKVSSLGCGLDHVMDAISECEQLVRSKGKSEEDAPWRLYFRKEVFVPWHNPEFCQVSSRLIFKQIAKGIRTQEYKTRAEDELVRFVARCWYIEHGHEMIPGKLQSTLQDYLPRASLSGGKSRDGWTQAVISSFTEQGFDKKCVPSEQVMWHIVVSTPSKWPLQFSGLFEAIRISGPRLPRNDIVLAISGRGIFILDEPYKIVTGFRYYELVEVFTSRSTKSHGQTFSLITIKGDEFTFMSPNADTVTKLITTFLDGLRQRSKCAIGLQDFILEDAARKSTFQFSQGEVLELLDDKPSKDDWVVGICDKTGEKGEFPIDSVYILPALEKPPQEFLTMFAAMSAADVSTLPRRRGEVRLGTASKGGTIRLHGVESSA